MMNVFLIFDQRTDIASDAMVQYLAGIMKDALRNPHKPRPEGENVIGEVARQCALHPSLLPNLILTCLEIPGQGS